MEYVLIWFFGSIAVAMLGMTRTIGTFGSFIISIFFSPVIGLIAVVLSKDKQTNELEKSILLKHTQEQNDMHPVTTAEASTQLEELEKVKEKKLITHDEYLQIRKRILSRIK